MTCSGATSPRCGAWWFWRELPRSPSSGAGSCGMPPGDGPRDAPASRSVIYPSAREGAMAKKGTGLLMVWADVPASKEDEFNRWYNEEHLPERMAIPGFL